MQVCRSAISSSQFILRVEQVRTGRAGGTGGNRCSKCISAYCICFVCFVWLRLLDLLDLLHPLHLLDLLHPLHPLHLLQLAKVWILRQRNATFLPPCPISIPIFFSLFFSDTLYMRLIMLTNPTLHYTTIHTHFILNLIWVCWRRGVFMGGGAAGFPDFFFAVCCVCKKKWLILFAVCCVCKRSDWFLYGLRKWWCG